MISFVLPTHDRPGLLERTLAAIGRLDRGELERGGDAEAIVVDNASDPPATVPKELDNGVQIRAVRRPSNEGAAVRNAGVAEARGEWIVMLDDDSHPLDTGFIDVLAGVPGDVAAIGGEILLHDDSREAGGLPEVFVGCGAAMRREVFLEIGGYDPAFGYYVEEYDFCARLLLRGHRVVHDRRFRVRHEKSTDGRDMDRILHRLVRNNGWVVQRYAPEAVQQRMMHETLDRYARVAWRESARRGYDRGLRELSETVGGQPRSPMDEALYDRFTGKAHVLATLDALPEPIAGRRVCIIHQGKNAWAVAEALRERDATIVTDRTVAERFAIGTLSPGPMWDAEERSRARGLDVLPAWVGWESDEATEGRRRS